MKSTLSTQELYLRSLKRQRSHVRLARVLILIIFLLQWELTADLGLVDSFIFSSPSRIIRCFFTLLQEQQLALHISMTVLETVVSFFLVLLFTLLLTTCLWLSPKVSRVLEPYLVILNSLPKSALAPLLIVWLGGNYKTIILTGMSVAVFGSILSLYTAFAETDPEKIKLIRTLGGTRMDILLRVMLPGNIPSLLSIMKVNIGLCLVGVIIGEFIAAKVGLGYLIIYGSQVFKLDWVILSILILCIVAMLLYQILGFLEKWYLKRH